MTNPPTEMTSLREIKDKLDALFGEVHQTVGIVSDQVAKLDEKIGFVLESQGKLLARLDAMDAGLHETAMRNHQQLRKELGDEIEKVEVLLLKKLAPPRKARKKARR